MLASMQVGIGSVWYEGNTCNMHLNDLAAEVKAGVVDAGAPPHLPWHSHSGPPATCSQMQAMACTGIGGHAYSCRQTG
jgi:Dehydratase family